MRLISKLKTTLASTGLYLLYLVGSCILTMLVEALFIFFLDHFVILPYPVLTVIRIVIYSVGVTAIMGFLGYFEGYREIECPIGETVTAYVLALIPFILLSMLFKFQGFISGAVRFTAGLVHNGWSITYDSLINKTPYSLFLLVFLGYAILYGLVLIICKYFGANRRICDRAELRKNETDGNL